MQIIRNLFLLCIVLSVSSLAYCDEKLKKEVYAFGFSASFTDSVVYFTNIQILDSIKLDSKGFLPERPQYSYQLKNYLEGDRGLVDRTCMIYFSRNKKKLQKEEHKLHEKYKKDKNVIVKQLTLAEFKFSKPEE